ncbi:hypothetical protein F4811DRAFT_559402 [Daldinia bambusicola]|nr:hypothetical protein F4811DRAFT_559402 [Daldinia bambusicola]
MEYQNFAYSDSMPLTGVYMDNSPIDGMLDPILKPSPQWTPSQMHRYLTEHNKHAFFNYSGVDPIFPETVVRTDDSIEQFPCGLPQRRNSPSFPSHTSSTSSSNSSPPRESDYYQPHSPPTPPDTSIMSPSLNQYDSPSSRAYLCQHTGLADACVKLLDINPYQESPESYLDDSNPKSEFPSRGYSMSSDDSSVCIGMCDVREPIGGCRLMSPEESGPDVKEEICIPEPLSSYAPYESGDETGSGNETETFVLKHEDGEDDEYKPYQKQKKTKSSTSRPTRNRKRQSSPVPTPEAKRPKINPSNSCTIGRPAAKPVIQGPKGGFSCTECPKRIFFKDENGLQNHIKKQHTRPFVCVFGFAGCNSTFASKNEWKRHCSSQHLVLHYWICQQDQCSKVSSKATSPARNRLSPPSTHGPHTPVLPRGTIFNRKDLYTQHLRRMHIPSNLKKHVKQRKPSPEWEARERTHQEQAKRTRCELPTHMRCPAIGCTVQFDGTNAWDDRMEHVAKHLEKAVTGSELPIVFGGPNDETLINWATRPEVAIIEKGAKGKWELRNPLKQGGNQTFEALPDQEGYEDAEGEDVDE